MEDLFPLLQERLIHYVPQEVTAPDRIPAAVLVPFFQKDGEPHLLFTKRTNDVQYHQGEICFPGGAKEDGEDPKATALRELYEEVMIPAENVEILGRLDSIRTVSSYFLVFPFVGIIQGEVKIEPNKTEVAEVLEVPYRHFLNPEIFRVQNHFVEDQWIPVYYYQWKSHTIWGLTARILKGLLDLMRRES